MSLSENMSLASSVGVNWHNLIDFKGALGSGCNFIISSINKRRGEMINDTQSYPSSQGRLLTGTVQK